MRRLIITTTAIAAVLSLAACSNNDNHDNTTNIDENLTAENIVSNDVTAIDAVTGDDANMAASAAIDDSAPLNVGNQDDAAPAKAAPAKTEPKPKPKPAAVKTDTTNTATGNSAG